MLSGNMSAVSFGKRCRKCAKILHEKNDNNFIRFRNYLCNYGTWADENRHEVSYC